LYLPLSPFKVFQIEPVAKEKITGTEITVMQPQLTRLDRRQYLPPQSSLLRMTVFSGEDLGHQSQHRLKHYQRFAGQGPRP
jgi:hypothetical protein